MYRPNTQPPSLHELMQRSVEAFDSQPTGEVASSNEDYGSSLPITLLYCDGYASQNCIQLLISFDIRAGPTRSCVNLVLSSFSVSS